MGDEPMQWEKLVPLVLHPIKVATIEALIWIEEPLSAVDVDRMHGETLGIPTAAYHLRSLASSLRVLRLYDEEAVRGANRKLYYFRRRTPASRRRRKRAA